MKAARFYDRGDIRIEDIPEPTPDTGEVLIKVAWCGICGTDLHEYLDGPIFCPTHDTPHPISGETAPVTMGHEFSGVIEALGGGIDDLEVGDHVVVEPYIIDDSIDTGETSKTYHLSPHMNFIGLAGRGGGLSEKVAVKRRWVHKISPTIPFDQAALIEPLSVGYHAVERAGDIRPGDVALVGGEAGAAQDGAVGQDAVVGARRDLSAAAAGAEERQIGLRVGEHQSSSS